MSRTTLGIEVGSFGLAWAVATDRGVTAFPDLASEDLVHVAVSGELVIGRSASARAVTDPAGAVRHGILALLAPPRDADPRVGVALAAAHLEPSADGLEARARGVRIPLARLVSAQLARAGERAAAVFGEPPERTVLAVPGWVGIAGAERLRRAAQAAGLPEVRIVRAAAATAMDLIHRGERGSVGIARIENGELEVSLAEIGDESVEVERIAAEVIAPGLDLEAGLAASLVDQLRQVEGDGGAFHASVLGRARETARRALAALAGRGEPATTLSIPHAGRVGHHLESWTELSHIEELLAPLAERLGRLVERVRGDDTLDVERWVVFGEHAFLPQVAQALREHLDLELSFPEASVASGAARLGAIDPASRTFVLDAAAHGLEARVDGADPIPLVEMGTPLPARVVAPLPPGSAARSVEVYESTGDGTRARVGVALLAAPPATGPGAPEVVLEVDGEGRVRAGIAGGDLVAIDVEGLEQAGQAGDERASAAGEHEALEDAKLALWGALARSACAWPAARPSQVREGAAALRSRDVAAITAARHALEQALGAG